MDDLPEIYNLQTIEQLRAIADPLRTRMYEALTIKPMTATQLGDLLGEASPKAHYHVRELERVGLVRLVETRERGGILEKYYRAVARMLRVPPQLLQNAAPDEVEATLSEALNSITDGFKTAMTRLLARGVIGPSTLELNYGSVWMTAEEFRGALESVERTFEPYKQPRGSEGEHEIMLGVVGYDAQLGRADTGKATPAGVTPPAAQAPEAPLAPQAPSAPVSPEVSLEPEREAVQRNAEVPVPHRVVVAGAVSYRRRDLEEVIERHQQLDLNVVGYISFADDVTPDLADRAIYRLRYRGVVSASAAVRAVLKRKEV